MILDTFQQLGLSKNEARIYQTLLIEGESSIGLISTKAKVHRRNVYDSIARLLEKGLVFEILHGRENRYQAVDPQKLRELVEEKELMLNRIMPDLERLYHQRPHVREVYIYRGIEGWKNYMRDILRVGEDFYSIGGKGAWMDNRLRNFFPSFNKEAKKAKLRYFHLFDWEVKERSHAITNYVGEYYRFFPQAFSAPATIDFFGDHVNMVSTIEFGGMEEEIWFTVIVNQQIADACRIWFRFMWEACPPREGERHSKLPSGAR